MPQDNISLMQNRQLQPSLTLSNKPPRDKKAHKMKKRIFYADIPFKSLIIPWFIWKFICFKNFVFKLFGKKVTEKQPWEVFAQDYYNGRRTMEFTLER